MAPSAIQLADSGRIGKTAARATFLRSTAQLCRGNWLNILIAAILAMMVLPPLWTLVRTSFSISNADLSYGGLTLQNYSELFQGRNLGRAALNSFLFALLSTATSLLIGGVMAWLVERTDVRFKSLAFMTTIISLGTPYVLYVAMWLFLLGRSGPLNDAYRYWVDPGVTLFNVNSLAGMVAIEGLLWSPLVFLLLSSTFRASNADMEEAARMAGASVIQTVWRISARLAWPAILALALFIFIRNLEAFEVPALIGMPGRVEVLTTEIYKSMREMPPRIEYASAFSVILLLVVSVLLYLYSRVSRQAARYASITGKGFRPRPFQLGRWRWLASMIVLLNFFVVLMLPLGALLWTAFSPFVRPIRLAGIPSLTLSQFETVLSSPRYLQLGINTIIVATAAATLTMLLMIVAGWLAARRKAGGNVIDQLVTVALIFPELVLGVALLELSLAVPFPFYGTLALLVVAFMIRYMPFGMRYTYSGVLQIHPELEEAAGTAGANTALILRRIVSPLLWPAIASGWLFIFLICAKSMALPLLLAGPDSQTISVAMFSVLSNGQGGEVAAMGLIWTALMTVIASAFYFMARRQSAHAFAH